MSAAFIPSQWTDPAGWHGNEGCVGKGGLKRKLVNTERDRRQREQRLENRRQASSSVIYRRRHNSLVVGWKDLKDVGDHGPAAPFGRLQREKHIEQLFRSLRQGRRGSQEPRHSLGEEAGQGDSGTLELCCTTEPEAQSSIPRVLNPAGATESNEHNLALLADVEQLCIIARPGLQGLACEPGRTYSISTATGSQLYVAVEDTSCLCLLSCGPARSCSLRGYDRMAQEVFLFERPPRADACCLGCCLMEMQAFTPDHQLIGTVRQKWSMFTPLMELSDSDGTSYIRIQGPCCPCRCYSTQEFQVVSKIGDKLGKIWKKWPGFNEEYNMDHEYFGLDVPAEMSPETKVLLLAAAFLLNYMFFEMS